MRHRGQETHVSCLTYISKRLCYVKKKMWPRLLVRTENRVGMAVCERWCVSERVKKCSSVGGSSEDTVYRQECLCCFGKTEVNVYGARMSLGWDLTWMAARLDASQPPPRALTRRTLVTSFWSWMMASSCSLVNRVCCAVTTSR